jgi:hypothetical protein
MSVFKKKSTHAMIKLTIEYRGTQTYHNIDDPYKQHVVYMKSDRLIQ